MNFDLLIYSIAFCFLAYAAYTDVKRLEVDLWVSCGLLLSLFSVKIIESITTHKFAGIWFAAFAIVFFFLVGYLMHVQMGFGGADVLLMAGIGGGFVKLTFGSSLIWAAFFFFALAGMSAIYGYAMFELKKKRGLVPFVPVLFSAVFLAETLWFLFG